MKPTSKIYIAGHDGMVGSAVSRRLCLAGFGNIVTRPLNELDLRRQAETEAFFEDVRPESVFLAAAKVGGIMANSTRPAEFIYDNLAIATNVIHAAWQAGVKKLLNFGSSCIYPRLASQPLKEEYLLTGELEPTNEAYAVAKIAAIKLCRHYNTQYGTEFLSVMPTNLYGPNDTYDLERSHVLPALIRKFHLAKLLRLRDWPGIRSDLKVRPLSASRPMSTDTVERASPRELGGILEEFKITAPAVVLWGTGTPRREFLHVDDLAEAAVFLMAHCTHQDVGELINIGCGEDLPIRELAEMAKAVVGFDGEIAWDSSKPDGTPRKLLDVSRLQALGWAPRTSLPEGIRATYTDYLAKMQQ